MYFAVEDKSSFGCKFILALEFIANTLSAWLVIALIIERLIYLHFPPMTKLFNRRMTGICIICMLVAIWYLFNSQYMLWLDLKGVTFHKSIILQSILVGQTASICWNTRFSIRSISFQFFAEYALWYAA